MYIVIIYSGGFGVRVAGNPFRPDSGKYMKIRHTTFNWGTAKYLTSLLKFEQKHQGKRSKTYATWRVYLFATFLQEWFPVIKTAPAPKRTVGSVMRWNHPKRYCELV